MVGNGNQSVTPGDRELPFNRIQTGADADIPMSCLSLGRAVGKYSGFGESLIKPFTGYAETPFWFLIALFCVMWSWSRPKLKQAAGLDSHTWREVSAPGRALQLAPRTPGTNWPGPTDNWGRWSPPLGVRSWLLCEAGRSYIMSRKAPRPPEGRRSRRRSQRYLRYYWRRSR